MTPQFTKPFKGIITNWRLNAGRIEGFYNGVKGDVISTSTMLHIHNMGTFGIAETRNSVYLLLDAMPK